MTAAEATLAGLLRAILLDPADDLARLVYADALDEAGEADRAEFVRVQVELAGLEVGGDLPRRQPARAERARAGWRALVLRHRERELESAPLATWARWCHPLTEMGSGVLWGMGRGLVESATLPCADFLRYAAALFAAQPVTAVRLSDREPRPTAAGNFSWWWRADDSGLPDPDDLPRRLWVALESRARGGRAGEYAWHATEADAHAALSAACVAWGRRQAGLPPLPGGR